MNKICPIAHNKLEVVPVDLLEKMREACQNAKPTPETKLQDVIINKETGDYTFIWEEKK